MTAVAGRADRPRLSEQELTDLAAAFEHTKRRALRSPADMAVFCDPSYHRRPHLQLISAELAKLATGETERLLIRTPPQVGKTRSAAVWAPFWWLANHPAHRVLIGSYSNSLAVARGRQIRRIVDVHGWRYGLEREYGEGAAADWALTAGGGVKAAGVSGGFTGSPGDLGIIDDPHKGRQEAESRAIRDRVWDWYSGDFLTRMAPSAPIVLIMTPWHEDDLSHRLLKQDGRMEDGGLWKVVDLPAFARPNDPLGRDPDAPLTHPKIPVDDHDAMRAFWEGRRRATSARDWVSLYMLEPKPTSESLVTEAMLDARTHNPLPAKPRRSVVAVDPSGGGKDNAGIAGGFYGDDRRAYVTHDRSVHGPSEVWGRSVVMLAAEIDADKIIYEKNYGGDQVEFVIVKSWQAVKREAEERARAGAEPAPLDHVFLTRHPPLVTWVHAKKNKQLRAEPIAQQINDDQLRFAPGMPDMRRQWTTWRPTDLESPGNLDACVYLGYDLLPVQMGPATMEAAPATPLPGTTPALGAGIGPGGVQVVRAQGDLQNRTRRPAGGGGSRRQSGWGPRPAG